MYYLMDKNTRTCFTYSQHEMTAFNTDVFIQVHFSDEFEAPEFSRCLVLEQDDTTVSIDRNEAFIKYVNVKLGKIRYNKEVEGFLYNGMPISTDREHMALMNATLNYYNKTPEVAEVVYKHKDGWATVTIAEFEAICLKQSEFFYNVLKKEHDTYSSIMDTSILLTPDILAQKLVEFSEYSPNL